MPDINRRRKKLGFLLHCYGSMKRYYSYIKRKSCCISKDLFFSIFIYKYCLLYVAIVNIISNVIVHKPTVKLPFQQHVFALTKQHFT